MSSVLQRAAARLRGLANTWDHSRKVPVKPSGNKYHGTVTGSTLVGKVREISPKGTLRILSAAFV
jgi:hypothetical protein